MNKKSTTLKKNPYHFIANLDAVLHLKWIHFNCMYTFTHFIFLIESNFNISLFSNATTSNAMTSFYKYFIFI